MSEFVSPYHSEYKESNETFLSIVWWEYDRTPRARFNNNKLLLMLDNSLHHEVSYEGGAPWEKAREKTHEMLGEEVGIASIDTVGLDADGFACFVKLKRGVINGLPLDIQLRSKVIKVGELNLEEYENDQVMEKFAKKHTKKH